MKVLEFLARRWWLTLGMTVALGGIVVVGSFLARIPVVTAAPGTQSSKIYDINGTVIGSFHGEQNRTIVDLSAISNNLRDAVVAAEDRTFYTHPGVSIRGIIRAALTNFRQGEIGQGASTITQQYARAVSGIGTERTYMRKIKEATLAVKIEKSLSKNKILEDYLNTVYFGRGAYGAEAAAQTYFKKAAIDLELAEAAYLAGIIRSPSRYQYDPTDPTGAGAQRVAGIKDQVLGAMRQMGAIDDARLEQAQAVPVHTKFIFGESAEQDSPRAGYFVEYVRKLLIQEFKISEADLLGGGLKIFTTLDLEMQLAAEEAVRSTINLPTDPEVALLAMDSQGHVKAMVGGRVVDDSKRARGFNFAANLPGDDGGRQPGSALKPLALAALVDQGKSVNSTFLAPSNIEIAAGRCRNADGTSWKVSNFGNAGYGALNLIESTTRSVNTVYAQVMEQVVSPASFVQMAAAAGIEIPKVDVGCALTLGTTPVTPLEMARAYATFAARGMRPETLMVLRVEGPDGTVIAERKPRAEQTIDQNVADTVSWILKQNIARGTGTGAKLPWPAMGKTGTAQNHGDASFAGSTPELTAVVWMGYPPAPQTDRNGVVRQVIPLMENVHGRKVTGGSFPATIWKKFMSVALKKYSKHSDFPTPKLTGEVLSPPARCPDPAPAGQPGEGDEGEQGEAAAQVLPSPANGGVFTVDSDGDGVLDAYDPSCQVAPSPSPEPSPVQMCGVLPCEPGVLPTITFTVPTLPRRSPCFPFDCANTIPNRNPTTTTIPDPEPPTTTKPPPVSTTQLPDCFPICNVTTTVPPPVVPDE
ncbi:MAG: transglycosylase domain-containing protein [Actinomycetota bacterium]